MSSRKVLPRQEGGRLSREDWRVWFERAWSIREEEVYPTLFGPHEPRISVLTEHMFRHTFKQETVDPRWLHSGILEVPPTPARPSWLCVSSGLSNAWDDEHPDPTRPSGLGLELVLCTPERAEWAIERLAHVVALQTLLSCGKYAAHAEGLSLHDRIPLGGSVSPQPSELTWLMVGPPDGLPAGFQLPSGSVELRAVVGITEAEAAYSMKHGGDRLLDLLRKGAVYPVTDWRRKSVLAD